MSDAKPLTPEALELSANQEDYIEVIHHIIAARQVARAKEIADRLGVSRASVTEALKSLGRKGLINYAPYEVITLTESGVAVAADIVHRHEALKTFLTDILALDEALAEEGACRIEHAAGPEIIERLIRFVGYVRNLDQEGLGLTDGFRKACGG